jgi:anti-sigma B factor antagonist
MDEQQPTSRYIHLETQGDVIVVHFADIQLATDAKDELYGLVENEGHKRILINFSNISSLSTFAFGVLANLQKKVHAVDGELRLCSLSPDLIKISQMMKFDRIFEIHGNQDDALRAF